MVDWLAGKRMKGTSSERTSLSTTALGGSGVGGWVELGRYTAGTTTTNLSVSSLPNKRYYMILENVLVSSDISHNQITFNSDTGSNYYQRTSVDGGADTAGGNTTYIENQSPDGTPHFLVGYIANYASNEKMLLYHSVKQSTAGAGTAPRRYEKVAKWTNTSNAFNKWNTYKNTAAAGSEVVVLGWDPADSHTSNFWQELASVQLGGAGDDISTGTITAKKYLWVQAYFEDSGGAINQEITFNNDTGNNYAVRHTFDGTADTTSTSRANGFIGYGGVASPNFLNFFIINNASNEKLVIGHDVTQNTAGAGTAPHRAEAVFKWTNTSNQITEIDFHNSAAGSFGTNTIIKVWGAD